MVLRVAEGYTHKEEEELFQNRDNVSEWGDMSIHGVLFQLDRRVELV